MTKQNKTILFFFLNVKWLKSFRKSWIIYVLQKDEKIDSDEFKHCNIQWLNKTKQKQKFSQAMLIKKPKKKDEKKITKIVRRENVSEN